MARVSFTALIEEIVGKLAGSVFQNSYGGWQIRTRVTPRNPQTTFQQLRRGEFGYISSLWRTLTDVQRQTFIDAAGTPPAALNLFIQSNVNLSLINESIINSYTTTADPGSMSIEFIDITPTVMTIRATGGVTTVPTGTKLLLQVTNQKPPTRIFTNPSDYSPVITFDEGTDLSISTDILSDWQSRFGVLTIDKRLCLKSALIDKSNGTRGTEVIQCAISELMPQKYIPLQFFDTDVVYAGGADETLYSFNMPANTMITDGDRLEVAFYMSNLSLIAFGVPRIKFDGNSTGNWGTGPNTVGVMKSTITRVDNASIRVNTTFEGDGPFMDILPGDIGGIDFTVANLIELNIQSAGAMTCTANQGYIDLIKAP